MISECAVTNISETPRLIPPLNHDTLTSSADVSQPIIPQDLHGPESQIARGETWVVTKVSVVISLIELRLITAVTRDTSLATVQVLFCYYLMIH